MKPIKYLFYWWNTSSLESWFSKACIRCTSRKASEVCNSEFICITEMSSSHVSPMSFLPLWTCLLRSKHLSCVSSALLVALQSCFWLGVLPNGKSMKWFTFFVYYACSKLVEWWLMCLFYLQWQIWGGGGPPPPPPFCQKYVLWKFGIRGFSWRAHELGPTFLAWTPIHV